MKRSFAVTIAGQRISLKSDADESYVQLLAELVDEKVRELGPRGARSSASEVALLAALRIADELLRERKRRAELRQQVRTQAQRLLDEIASISPVGPAAAETPEAEA